MKFFLLPLFAVVFVSCSNSETTDSTPGNTLKKTEENIYIFSYDSNSAITDTVIVGKDITLYEEGRPIKKLSNMGANTPRVQYTYTYNENGFLASELMEGPSITPQRSDFSYDAQHRLTKVVKYAEQNTTQITQTDIYIYGADYIINTKTLHSGSVTSLTYKLNPDNTFKRIDYNGSTTTYNYSGQTLTAVNTTSGLNEHKYTWYTYNNAMNPAILGLKHLGGDYWPNRFFINNYLYHYDKSVAVPADQYLVKVESNLAGNANITYEFKENGQPHKRVNTYPNSGTFSEIIYFYE